MQIRDQLDLYENQHTDTIRSYLKNWQEEIAALEKRYEKTEKDAEERYNKALGTENFKDQDNVAYARHISGIEYLSHKKSEEIESIKDKYSDFLDLFSKSTLIALYSAN